jgi:hypothetical protein
MNPVLRPPCAIASGSSPPAGICHLIVPLFKS